MEWVRGETFGQGSFATASLAKPKKQSPQLPQLMAVKSCGDSHSSSLITEGAILHELRDCQQIIRCSGYDLSFQNGKNLCNLFLENSSGGSLSDKLRRSVSHNLPEFELRQYTRSILKEGFYIHKHRFVQCDIKSQNILLCSENYFNKFAKVGDFGLTKRAGFGREKVELRGMPMCMSLEMVAAGEQEAPADIWALGCLVGKMASRALVWRFTTGLDEAPLLMRIGAGGEVPDNPGVLSDDGKDFIGKCFIRIPKKRRTIKMILDYPFVADSKDYVRGIVAPDRYFFGARSSTPRGLFDLFEWDNSLCKIPFLPSLGFDV